MGWYGERLLPRLVDLMMRGDETDRCRRRVCAGLSGEMVEIGFGSGLNTPFYPVAVTRVLAVEPSDRGWELSAKRREASTVPVERVGLDGQQLPLADDSADVALSTWTLCSVPDAGAAIRELRRVLRPGGTLHFVEHGLAPDDGVQTWQRRLEPLQRRLVGGCHLTRVLPDLLQRNGFELVEVEQEYMPGVSRTHGSHWLGVARPV